MIPNSSLFFPDFNADDFQKFFQLDEKSNSLNIWRKIQNKIFDNFQNIHMYALVLHFIKNRDEKKVLDHRNFFFDTKAFTARFCKFSAELGPTNEEKIPFEQSVQNLVHKLK